jgi:hypothetical protein
MIMRMRLTQFLLIAGLLFVGIEAKAQTPLQEFAKRHKADLVIGADRVQANPYVLNDQSYIVMLRFIRMTSPSAGVFSGMNLRDRNVMLYVSKVPTSAFRGGEQIVAAVRIVGIHDGTNFPHAELIGFQNCKASNCSDFDH